MRQPGPTLAPVDAAPLEPLLQVVRERSCTASVVLEGEHADAPRLAIAGHRETNLPGLGRRPPKVIDDRIELPDRPMPEERERDMQVLAADEPDARQLAALPSLDLVEDVIGQP